MQISRQCAASCDKIYRFVAHRFYAIKTLLMFSYILSVFNTPVKPMMTGVNPAKIQTEEV